MKTLSMKQPHEDIVDLSKKKTDLKKWDTKFKGEFSVHASIKPNMKERINHESKPEQLDKSAIIDTVTIKDVKCYDTFEKITEDMDLVGTNSDIIKHIRSPMHGLVLERHEMLEVPMPFKGHLGFKKKDDEQ